MLDLQVAEPSRFEASRRWAIGSTAIATSTSARCRRARPGSHHTTANGYGCGCYLPASGRSFTAASDLSLEPIHGSALYDAISLATALRMDDPNGHAERCVQVCGGIVLDPTTADLLLEHVPGVARIPAGVDVREVVQHRVQAGHRDVAVGVPTTAGHAATTPTRSTGPAHDTRVSAGPPHRQLRQEWATPAGVTHGPWTR
jgi:hypothetical protein